MTGVGVCLSTVNGLFNAYSDFYFYFQFPGLRFVGETRGVQQKALWLR